jgi:hypothetical protein
MTTTNSSPSQGRGVGSRSTRLAGVAVAALVVFGAAAYLIIDRSLYSSDADFVGTWVLDAESTGWLGRTCAMMNFNEQPPQIMIRRSNGEVFVRFNDVGETTFIGRRAGRQLTVRQLVPATETGRFCSDPLVVQIRLGIRASSPDILRASWTLPNCDVCPDQQFTARRT